MIHARFRHVVLALAMLLLLGADTAMADIGSIWTTTVTDGSIVVGWSAQDDGDDYRKEPGNATPYKVCWKKTGGLWTSPCNGSHQSTGSTSLQITGLPSNTEYKIKVECRCQKKKNNGKYKDTKTYDIGVLKQKTLSQSPDSGNIKVIGATSSSLTVEFVHSNPSSFAFIRLCYKKEGFVTSLNGPCQTVDQPPSAWTYSDHNRGWLDMTPATSPFQVSFGGLRQGRRYKIVSYGFYSGNTIGLLIGETMGRTDGKNWPPWSGRMIRDDHADLFQAYAAAVNGFYVDQTLFDHLAASHPELKEVHAALLRDGDEDIRETSALMDFLIESDSAIFTEWQRECALVAAGKSIEAFVRQRDPAVFAALLDDIADSIGGPGAWTTVDDSPEAREGQTATLLPDGRVLVVGAGGLDTAAAASSRADVYDPAKHAWTTLLSMRPPRRGHTATLLPAGKVLIAGGDSGPGQSFVAASLLYDPRDNRWTTGGTLSTPRRRHTATLLPTGRLLAIGGEGPGFLDSVESYDPSSDSWRVVGRLNVARSFHTATLLPDGRTLVVGGAGAGGRLKSIEAFNPVTGNSTIVGSLLTERAFHTATLLANGRVLIAGGDGGGGLGFPAEAELIDPATGDVTATGALHGPRRYHTATLLPDGRVLVVGGDMDRRLGDAEAYDPATGEWRAVAELNAARALHSATWLRDDSLLVVAGRGESGLLSSAEIYDPDKGAPAPVDTPSPSHTPTAVPTQPLTPTSVPTPPLVSGSLGNISTRGLVGTGDNVLIGGLIVTGRPTQVVLRAIGPSLALSGVPNPLQNPRVRLFSGQVVIAENDDWGTGNCRSETPPGLWPKDPREACLVMTLAPGPYTAIVDGVGAATGIGMVEVFKVSQ